MSWMLAIAVLFLLSEAAAGEPAVALDKPRLAQAPEPLLLLERWPQDRRRFQVRTTQGRRVATCGRVVNMMSWEVTETACPES
jgi:hypothetical protein